VTLSRKGAKSQPRVRGLRSNGTKARTHVERLRAANADLKKKLAEALEQQTATSEVLQVISRSPGELQPVFEAMLANAVRVIGSKFGTMYLRDGEAFRIAAMHGAPRAYFEALTRQPLFRPGPETALGRTAKTRQVVQIADLEAEAKYRKLGPRAVAAMELGGVRTVLSVPMLKDNELLGTIAIYRAEVCPFTDKQIELVQNFAAQAVIAIENTRLLNELRESLQQQTATADVLKVISSSPGELQFVFQSMLDNAMRICDAKFGIIFEFSDGAYRSLASLGVPQQYDEHCRQKRVWGPDTLLGEVECTDQFIFLEHRYTNCCALAREFNCAERDPDRLAAHLDNILFSAYRQFRQRQ
jgi:hypothetical protein